MNEYKRYTIKIGMLEFKVWAKDAVDAESQARLIHRNRTGRFYNSDTLPFYILNIENREDIKR